MHTYRMTTPAHVIDMTAHRRRSAGLGAVPTTSGRAGLELDVDGKQRRSNAKGARMSHRRLELAVCIIFLAPALAQALHLSMPSWLGKLLLLNGGAYVGWRLLTFSRWGDEHQQVPRFLWCFSVCMLELAWENCMVWLVSWSDRRKYDDVPGLQDNVLLAVQALAQHSPLARTLAHGRWCNILHFLVAMLAIAFSPLWEQVPYSGFGMFSRVLLSIAFSRVLRVASFMSTVLPNPLPGCYRRRFPPPPEGIWDTIKAGYTTIRGFGGCNDLVFSGHGAFWTLAPLMFSTYAPSARFANALLWCALLHTSLGDVVYQQHYSVDMILSVVVTWAVWSWLKWVYPEDRPLQPRPPGSKPDRANPWVLAVICIALLFAGIIVIGGKA